MNHQAKLVVAFIGLSLFALVSLYFFWSGLVTGEASCIGRGCRGTVSLATQANAYFLSMAIAGFSAIFMGALAAFAFVQLIRGGRVSG